MRSSAFPWANPFVRLKRTLSPSAFSADHNASVASTLPNPMMVIFLRLFLRLLQEEPWCGPATIHQFPAIRIGLPSLLSLLSLLCPHRSPLQRTTNSPSSAILCGIIAMEGDFMRARSTPRYGTYVGRLSTMHPIASHDARFFHFKPQTLPYAIRDDFHEERRDLELTATRRSKTIDISSQIP